MESPYFGNHWSNFAPRRSSRYSPIVRDVPVQRPAAKPSPKVVSIPVHFVGSEQSRSDSALKIQKVFRGFLVRKSMKKIAAIKGEVDEIEKKMSQKDTIDLIRKDAKERLRVNETLMSLLIRLDSVKGVDSGVRVCRKTVIKKAISLQERVDSIVAGDQTLGDDQVMETNETLGFEDDNGDKAADCTPELEPEAPEVDQSEIDLNLQATDNEEDCDSELQNLAESMPNLSPAEVANGENKEKEESAMANVQAVTKEDENKETHEASGGKNGDDDEDDALSQTGSSVDPQSPISVKEEDEMETVQAEKEDDVKIEENTNLRAKEGDNKKNKELLERMMEENEKMMSLMADLYEKNQLQIRLLSSLSRRVELLERAFVCDKLRKKKKRRASAAVAASSATTGSVDCLEKCQDANATKKCEKRW